MSTKRERGNALRLAVFGDAEIVRGEIANEATLLVDDPKVDHDGIDVASKDRERSLSLPGNHHRAKRHRQPRGQMLPHHHLIIAADDLLSDALMAQAHICRVASRDVEELTTKVVHS
jgi:hypothetical protein